MNCMDCNDHLVLPDPDPYDSFCDDDMKVLCLLRKDTPPKLSPSGSGHPCTGEPYITVSCRPYLLRKECEQPEWCPLRETKKLRG